MSSAIPTSELNMRCAGVKRLLKEACELRVPDELFIAKPMEDNLFEWHFTIRGPPDSVYHNGIYHGRIILPVDYPMKPPSLILLTPNGRFETNKKICLSISGYHPETWLPSWSIRTALLALIGFMPTHSKGALGGLECSEAERRRLATKSLDWRCETCECTMREILPLMQEAAAASSNSALLDELEKASKANETNSMDASAKSDPQSAATTTTRKTTTNTNVPPPSSSAEAPQSSSSHAGIIAGVVSAPIRILSVAFALISAGGGRNSPRTSGGGEAIVGGVSEIASGVVSDAVNSANIGASVGTAASINTSASPPNRADPQRSWPTLVLIFALLAVFFALLLRRVLNA